MNKKLADGRTPVVIAGHTFIPEKQAADRLDIGIMRLRRSAIMQIELRATSVDGHPYYMESEVKRIREAFAGHVMRHNLSKKPITATERIAAKETVIYGIVCYPRLSRVDKSQHRGRRKSQIKS